MLHPIKLRHQPTLPARIASANQPLIYGGHEARSEYWGAALSGSPENPIISWRYLSKKCNLEKNHVNINTLIIIIYHDNPEVICLNLVTKIGTGSRLPWPGHINLANLFIQEETRPRTWWPSYMQIWQIRDWFQGESIPAMQRGSQQTSIDLHHACGLPLSLLPSQTRINAPDHLIHLFHISQSLNSKRAFHLMPTHLFSDCIYLHDTVGSFLTLYMAKNQYESLTCHNSGCYHHTGHHQQWQSCRLFLHHCISIPRATDAGTFPNDRGTPIYFHCCPLYSHQCKIFQILTIQCLLPNPDIPVFEILFFSRFVHFYGFQSHISIVCCTTSRHP